MARGSHVHDLWPSGRVRDSLADLPRGLQQESGQRPASARPLDLFSFYSAGFQDFALRLLFEIDVQALLVLLESPITLALFRGLLLRLKLSLQRIQQHPNEHERRLHRPNEP